MPEAFKGINHLEVREAPDGSQRAVCNLLVLSQFSVPDSSTGDSHSLNPSSYENSFAIELAIQHLNQRNGTIVRELGTLEACDIDFEADYIDTKDDAVTASRQVASRILLPGEKDGEPGSRNEPCALIGATSSFSESIQTSVLVNIRGYPFVSGMNHLMPLAHESNFPRFARTIPGNHGPASALVRYANEVLRYEEKQYLVFLRANTDHSNDYVRSLRNAISESYDLDDYIIEEIVVRKDGTNIEEAIKRLKELRITTVMAIFEGIDYSDNLYDKVMEEAHEQGVAGEGHHVWLFPESLLEYSLYIQQLRNPYNFVNSTLLHAYKGSGFIKSGGMESKYTRLVNGIQEQAASPGYMEYMESVLPNSIGDTNATRDLLNTESFLNERSLDSRIQFLYDATVLVGLAACKASTEDLFLDDQDFYDAIVASNVNGTSGPIEINPRGGSRMPDSTEYSIVNIQRGVDFRIALKHTATIYKTDVVRVADFVYSDGTTQLPTSASEVYIQTEVAPIPMDVITSILCVMSIAAPVVSAVWTYRHRNTRIIRASQAFFLYLICFGSCLWALSMVPIIVLGSVDLRNTDQSASEMCLFLLWSTCCGFSIIFSSFYSKLYRINKIMSNSRQFKRVNVRVRDVIHPVRCFPF